MANRNESPSQEPSIEEQPQPQPQDHCKENGYVNTVHETIELQDDPRKWSPMRKWITLATVANGSLVVGFAPNIYNPAIDAIKSSLHAQDWHISLTLSLFILLSGIFPMPWSLTSELVGRKRVYMVSLTIALGGYIGAAVANSIGLLIGMRCIQAMGNSSLFSVGAGSLTDIYDVHERGTKFGIYYAAPMLGPSLGPVLGGILTKYLSWRATFWFLAIWIGVTIFSVLALMKESFRKDRSTTYQDALAIRTEKIARRQSQAIHRSSCEEGASHHSSRSKINVYPTDLRVATSLKRVVKKRNNVVLLIATGLNYGFTYSISYTCTLSLSDKYHLDALKIGLVLLAYGLGSMAGSVLGGRYSDYLLARSRSLNNTAVAPSEVRLATTIPGLIIMPALCLAYGWMAQYTVHISGIAIILFFGGLSSIWVYSPTMSYLLDINPGNTTVTVACNSFIRGLLAFLFAEVAVPLQNAIGDGGLYSLWAGLWALCAVLILIVYFKGGHWRAQSSSSV
ncbi:hypothetical protein ANOM_004670 [Aspergillus nomiae NRRL 13137]|uniref:Major facilitator superfamily (MFS) profile domain-containing protein n=1 Tax=Aspergillus nomiae NRRL (strain ATCC 15546 / NRRL 13137 / CBS 260.88 / M93) TaxID=1509407 RepID=A0A0L1J5T3_ASPN3|nr:uncharacterized protein ANOM_004670 [Aspergillus nomiae NRRL 13137]KNG87020.1 hypothetical protein ANOM_004670 [Aspergillus nomiae NRRL 13137]